MTQTLERPPRVVPPPDEGFPSPRMPQRVMVRAYPTYTGAARAVDRLAREHGIPRNRVTLVARGLQWVRDSDASQAMVAGLRSGALVGAIAGFVLYLIGFARSDLTVFLPTVMGAVAGGIAGLLAGHLAYMRAGRDTPADDGDGRLEVEHYDVLVDEEIADEARDALAA